MMPRLQKSVFFAVLFLVLLSGAAAQKAQKTLETRPLTIARTDGSETRITAELARTEVEKQAGLMYRKALEDGRGMLFYYDKDQTLSFWMKNTQIPLSIAFISSRGEILEVRDMEPFSTIPVKSARAARYALEAPLGWFKRSGVETGSVISGF